MYLQICSREPMDVMGLILFGASTKRDDHGTIGQFGTGLKYSVATLLRNDIDFDLFIGGKHIQIGTALSMLGEKTFNRIVIDGENTSLTTELGMNWLVKHALREIITNAMDTGDFLILKDQSIAPEGYGTVFKITMSDPVIEFMNDWDMLFISEGRKPISTSSMGSIYEKTHRSPTDGIYTKRVHCVNMTGRTSLFDYDHNDIKLSELRLAESSFEALAGVRQLIASCTNKDVMKRILLASSGEQSIEAEAIGDLRYGYDNVVPLNQFVSEQLVVKSDDVKRLTAEEREHVIVVGDNAYAGLSQKCTSMKMPRFVTERPDPYALTASFDGDLIREVCQSMQENGIDVAAEEIRVAAFEDPDTLGMVHDGLIVISEKIIQDKVKLAGTIVEEYIHRRHNVQDCTREFQNAAMDIIGMLVTR